MVAPTVPAFNLQITLSLPSGYSSDTENFNINLTAISSKLTATVHCLKHGIDGADRLVGWAIHTLSDWGMMPSLKLERRPAPEG